MRAISPSLAISAVTLLCHYAVAAAGAAWRRKYLESLLRTAERRSAAADEGSGWALTLLVAVRFGIATRQEGPTKHEDKRLKASCLEAAAIVACSRPGMPSSSRASLPSCLPPFLPALTRKNFVICHLFT
ncbi:hypothetical protein J3F84DRAFT_389151 [Trichoderma pleuroticola]